jgi:pimeloyl-ACP methyl ester carboxylesterase
MNTSNKYHFVLVHGAWHGAWCWEKVIPLLSDVGHAVHAIDLPGLGEEQTPVKDVTLKSYVFAVNELINSIDQAVVLVGHSMGGMVITQVAEQIPDRINTLIYLTAFSPRNRETLLQYALEDTSDVMKYKQINEEEGYFTVAEDKLQSCFYGMCSDEDAQNAIKRLRPQPLAPIATPLKLSDENYGRVRRCYVECSEDRAITPAMQTRLKNNGRVDATATLKTDHSPFYSCPEQLVETLVSLA